MFHLKPGHRSEAGAKTWNIENDELLVNKINATWQLLQGDITRHNEADKTGWTADSTHDIKFEVQTATTTIGFLNLKIQSNTTKSVTIGISVDGRKTTITVDNHPKWFSLQYFREDFDDKKLLIEILPGVTSTPPIISEIKMISDK